MSKLIAAFHIFLNAPTKGEKTVLLFIWVLCVEQKYIDLYRH
jgi:hypothetical protein